MNINNYKDCRNIKICPTCKLDMKRYYNQSSESCKNEDNYFHLYCRNRCYDVRYWKVDSTIFYEEYCRYETDSHTISFLNQSNEDRTYVCILVPTQDFALYIDKISFINDSPDLDRLLKRLLKLIIIS